MSMNGSLCASGVRLLLVVPGNPLLVGPAGA
jgi:hypothetical protein